MDATERQRRADEVVDALASRLESELRRAGMEVYEAGLSSGELLYATLLALDLVASQWIVRLAMGRADDQHAAAVVDSVYLAKQFTSSVMETDWAGLCSDWLAARRAQTMN